MVTIIVDEKCEMIGKELYNRLLRKNMETNYISLDNVEVKPCYSCRGCTDKTYGKCIVRDDGDWIYPKLIKSEAVVLVTPIVFGNYSFKIKRVLDKCAVIGSRYYKIVNKELTKTGFLGKFANLYAIGVKDNCSREEKEAFEQLFHETLIITTSYGRSFVVSNSISSELMNKMTEEIKICKIQ